MADKKKFGLIMPKKTETLKMRTNSIFNDDDSDEDVLGKKRPKIPQKKIDTKKIKIETLEDPSIYEYDSIYDEMKNKQTESLAPKEKKNSRYIETLLKAAEKRKKEYERRIDKKIQVEREKEGDKYKDKEAFVTSAYKKKMQEREEEEERERRENMLNDMMDVTKQKDLSGFYRHFLNQTIGEEKIPVFGEKDIKKEVDSDQDVPANKASVNAEVENIDRDSDGVEIDDDDDRESSDKNSFAENEKKKESRKRSHEYRKYRSKPTRQASEVSSSPEPSRKHTRKSNKSSNSGGKSDSDSEPEKEDSKDSHLQEHRNINKSSKMKERNSRHDSLSSNDDDDDDDTDRKSTNGDKQPDAPQSEDPPKINIYVKRTVGNVFADAQARYFQRMAEKNLRT